MFKLNANLKTYIIIFIVFIITVNAASVRLCTGCIKGNNQDITKECCFSTGNNHLWNNNYSNLCFVSIESESDFENCCKRKDCYDH